MRLLRGLLARGTFELSLVVFEDVGVLTSALLPKVKIVGDAARSRALRFSSRALRRLVHHWPGMQQIQRSPAVDSTAAWRRADADVYVAMGVGNYTADLAEWCRGNGRKLLLLLGSDIDVSPRYTPDARGHNEYGSELSRCWHGLALADMIAAQTQTQRKALQGRVAADVFILANPIEGCRLDFEREFVLWVGKSDEVKRPDLMVEVARRLPELRIRMIMNVADQDIARRTMEAAPSNVEIIDRVHPAEMPEQFARARVLVNTSRFEGMPNAFLEAGLQATPVASLNADPDGLLEECGGGICAHGDLDVLVGAILALAQNPAERGSQLQRIVNDRHEPTKVAQDLESHLLDLVSKE